MINLKEIDLCRRQRYMSMYFNFYAVGKNGGFQWLVLQRNVSRRMKTTSEGNLAITKFFFLTRILL